MCVFFVVIAFAFACVCVKRVQFYIIVVTTNATFGMAFFPLVMEKQ